MKKTIVDRAADFVLAVERVFGVRPRLLDGSRAVLIGDVKLSLEAREKELCVIRMHGALEEWLAENGDDPDAREIRRRHEQARSHYLEFQRELLGWAIFVGRKS